MIDNEVDQYFRELERMDPPEPAMAVPTAEVRDAVLAYPPEQRLRPERIARLLAAQGVDAPVDQVRGALAGL